MDGREYVLEYPIKGDYALIAAHQADTLGNLVYRKTARNFGPVMATAATTTIVAAVPGIVIAGLAVEILLFWSHKSYVSPVSIHEPGEVF